MSRPLRIELAGAVRGRCNGAVTLRAIANHYHFVLETPDANLILRGMRQLKGGGPVASGRLRGGGRSAAAATRTPWPLVWPVRVVGTPLCASTRTRSRRVNATKSGTGRLWKCPFRGFRITGGGRMAQAKRRVERRKGTLREAWQAPRSVPVAGPSVRGKTRFAAGCGNTAGHAGITGPDGGVRSSGSAPSRIT
jgi:hypothetical protein